RRRALKKAEPSGGPRVPAVFGVRSGSGASLMIAAGPPAGQGARENSGGLGGEHGGHALAFPRPRLLDLGAVGQLLQHAGDDPLPLLDVLQLPPAEEHVQQHLVLVFEELAGLADLGVDVVFAGLGADADLLQLLLMDLGLVALLLGLLVAEL